MGKGETPLTSRPVYWCLYSGGKDSTACAYYLAEREMLAGLVALDTGISTPDWMTHVAAFASAQGWPLEVYRTSASYDALVRKFGFPGPPLHGLFMNYLKGRGVRQFKRAHPGAILASGVRRTESVRRFATVKEWRLFEGVTVWAPLMDWTDAEVWDYLRARKYQRPPAYQVLCISGDCLCGAFAGPMEREAIRAFYPNVSARLDALEGEIGRCWGARRSARALSRRQLSLPSPVCVDCGR